MRDREAGRLSLAPRVAEAIAADLRQQILRGDVDDDNFPRQDDLMRRYSVSGPSVRESLRILEAEGLISVRRGKVGGAYVRKPDWASVAYAFAISLQGQGVTLRDLAESIKTLEPMCAAGCARREDRAETIVPALRANLAAAEAAMDDGANYSTTARAFHHILVQGLGSESMRLMARSFEAVWSVQERIWAQTVTASAQYPSSDQLHASFKTHATMLRLIEDGDADGAADLSLTHLTATQVFVLERIGDETVDASSLAAVQAFKTL